jgi:hypothetical protein
MRVPRSALLRAAVAALPVLLAGCIDQPPDPSPDQAVFQGAFPAGFEPMAFDTSRLNALGIDTYQTFDGQDTIRIDVPSSSASPGYAGGPWKASGPLDLSGYTALTFWTRAARPVVVEAFGYGYNFLPLTSRYQETVFGLPLTTEWIRHLIPIPDPSRLVAERGIFWYVDADPVNYSFWLADMRYVHVDPALIDLRPGTGASAIPLAVGRKGAFPLTLSYADFDGTRRWLDSTDPGLGPAPAYFSFDSSDWAVATVDGNGTVTGVAPGTAVISARLGQVALPQAMTVTVTASVPAAPTAAPPAPTQAPSDVKSIYSDSYPLAVPGVIYGTNWSNGGCQAPQWPNCGNLTELNLGGNHVQRFTGLHYVGIDFTGTKIDASAMNYFHVDVWTPDANKFGVKLVSFPPGGGQVERQVSFNGRATHGGTVPPIVQGSWVSLDIPLSLFGDLPRATIGLLLWLDDGSVSGGGIEGGTFFIDNAYFHK